MKIEINKKCKTSQIDRIDDLIKEYYELFNSDHNILFPSNHLSKEYDAVILHHLLTKTNCNKVFESLGVDFGLRSNKPREINSSMKRLHEDKSLEPTLESFVIILNDIVREMKQKDSDKLIFYIPTIIEFICSKDNISDLKNDLETAVKISLNEDVGEEVWNQIKSDFYKSYFSLSFTVVCIRERSRDAWYSWSKVVSGRVRTFCGIIAYIKYSKREAGFHNIPQDDSIGLNQIEDTVLIVNNRTSSLVYPTERDWSHENLRLDEKYPTAIGKQRWQIRDQGDPNDYYRLKSILSQISSQNNKKMREIIDKSFSTYYDAIIEGDLALSFFKFWIIIEYIYHHGEQEKGDKLKKFLKGMYLYPHLETRIDVIIDKRNKFVHEYYTDNICREDRDLVKHLAEQFIDMILDPEMEIKNLEDWDNYLRYSFTPLDEIKKSVEFLQRMVEWKSKSDEVDKE